MSTFVLVHGAWHGAWCWERVAPLLREAGQRVITPDLPGHGADRTPPWRVTLGSYARRVRNAAREGGERAIAVGHSMDGVVITQAAAREPGLFAGLVYVCAFVPEPGESLMTLARQDRDSRLRDAMVNGITHSTVMPGRAADIFYGACSAEAASAAVARLGPQPSLPAFQRVAKPRGPQPARAYIECTEDRAIGIALQRQMRERTGIARVATLATDHSPFYSAAEMLAGELNELAAFFAAA